MKRVVVGPRAALEAIRAAPDRVQVVYVDAHASAARGIAAAGAQAKVSVETRDAAALDAIAKGLRHQGVVALTGDYPYRSLDEVVEAARSPATLVLCDGIEDPQNLGAILRASVFFGADGVVLPRHRAAPVTAAAVRASAGASEHAKVARVTNLADAVADLAERGFSTIALAAEAPDALAALDLTGPVALVVGGEHAGVRPLVRKRAGLAARLPGAATVASLNAAAATAVALYEVGRQRQVGP